MKQIERIGLALVILTVLTLAGTGCTAKAKKAYHLSRANRYYQSGQLRSAEMEYLNTLRYDANNGEAFGRLGQIYYDQGRLQRAFYFLNRGQQLAPENLDVRLKLGFLDSAMGQFAPAQAQANYVLDRQPQSEEAILLLAESSVTATNEVATRRRLQALAHNGDRAVIEVALGNLALRDQDVAGAEADYKKAQALDGKSALVNAALAGSAWARGEVKAADAFFKAAAAASPARSPHRMQYARFKLDTGDTAGARAVLEGAWEAAPDYVPAGILLGQIAASGNQFDESSGWLKKVLAIDPDNFEAQLLEAKLDLARGAPDVAVAALERLAHANPQMARAHYELGAAYFAAKEFSKAAESLQRALKLNSNLADATLLLARIEIQSGDATEALPALEILCQKQPGLVPAELLLADAYRMQNRVGDAVALYSKLEKAYPTNAPMRLLHGVALLQLGDRAGARKAFELAHQWAPDDQPTLEQLVNLDIGERQFAAATQLVEGEIQKSPKQVEPRILAAKVQLAHGQRDQAEATLAGVLTLDPGNLSAQLLLAQLFSDGGERKQALEKLDAVMATNPKNAPGLMLAAQIYEANKDYSGAASAYEKLLQIDPRWSPALNNLACLYSERLDKLDRAYELARRAHDLLPFNAQAADTLGWICYQRGEFQTALGLLQESATRLAASPDPQSFPEVQYHLGLAAYMSGEEAVARAAFQKVMQVGASTESGAECRRFMAWLDLNPATADAAAVALLEKRKAEAPGDPVVLLRLARIHQRAGSTAQAITDYEAHLRAAPKDVEAMVDLIPLYAAKDPKPAYEMAKAASKLAPYDPRVLQLLGQQALLAGDDQAAANALQQALQTQPNDPALLYDYGCATYRLGGVAAARAALESALARNLKEPEAAEARRRLSLITLAAAPAQAAGASARIADALKANPRDVAALMAQAAAGEYRANRAEAEQVYEQVLAVDRDFLPAQLQLARLYVDESNHWDRAYALAAHLHDVQPEDPQVTKLTGVALLRRGDDRRALNLLQQCVMSPNADAEVFYYLGTAQFHLKNRADSKASLQKALTLNLAGPLADSARKMLGELK